MGLCSKGNDLLFQLSFMNLDAVAALAAVHDTPPKRRYSWLTPRYELSLSWPVQPTP